MKEKVQIGMHASIAGGLSKAVNRTVETASECFQIFARNPRGWLARPLEHEEISEFRTVREHAGLWPLAVHTVYLVNLAASDPVLLARSRDAFREEIMRSLALGEQTGKLDESLDRAKLYYAREIPAAVRRVVTLIQPAMIIILGGVILMVALAIMLPILNIYNTIGVRR